MRKARQGGATPEKGVPSGKLLFQRRFGAKATQSSLAICRHQKCCCSGVTATTTMTAATTRPLQRRRILAGGLRGAACTCTVHSGRADNPICWAGERERMESCALLRGAAHSPHSALPAAGTEFAAGSSHQPWAATLCWIKGCSQDQCFCLLQ